MKCNKCNSTCGPAEYDCDFSVEPNPFDSSKVNINVNGATKSIKLPNSETDTKLSINTVDNTLNYSAERHTDTLTGAQLGSLVELKDLSDVRIDEGLDGNCYELIYHKYGNCGEGCISPLDAWSNFSPFAEGATQDYMHFVRGANAYGCPVYLDIPTNPNQYWFAGWKKTGEHHEFGYYQPESVSTLPTDAMGNYRIMSANQDGKPVIGILPLNCILGNMMGNLGIDITGSFSVLQQTPQFSANFNNITGDFYVEWNDWYYNFTQHVGTGRVTGKMHWTSSFNPVNGHMNYQVTSVDFYDADWTVDQGAPTTADPIFLTFKAVSLPSGTETTLIDQYEYNGRQTWHINLDRTVQTSFSISLAPSESAGPFNFSYIYVDWEGSFDDEGYLRVEFKNKLQGWQGCN